MSMTERSVDTIALRGELKQWESQFKAANNGRRARREDIKKDATISAKYKLYDRLTRPHPPSPHPSHPPHPPNKQQQQQQQQQQRQQQHQKAVTPRKRNPSQVNPHQSSPAEKATTTTPRQTTLGHHHQHDEPTPAFIRNALGPTPQKDGHVLGLFDMLAEDTPLKENAADMIMMVGNTPSKSATSASSDDPHFKSPQDSDNPLFLHPSAATPLKRKRDDDDHIATTTSSKRNFATPSFLRRSFPLASIHQDAAELPSKNSLFRKRGLVRSLSSIIQGLKKQEEQRMDDDWDVLNDIEEEEHQTGQIHQSKENAPTATVHAKDSQTLDMPLGPDQALESGSDGSPDEAETTARKPWKKKGLKRQTRRVNMRPVLHKAKKANELGSEPNSEQEVDTIAETQLRDDITAGEGEHSSADSHDELTAAPKSNKTTGKGKTTSHQDKTNAKTKKVDPNKHANFRKLNIKNKNSKANGRGRKFGRR